MDDQEQKILNQALKAFGNVQYVARYPEEAKASNCNPNVMLKELTPNDRSNLLSLHAKHGSDISRIELMPDHDKCGTSIGSHVLVLSPDAKIDEFTSDVTSSPFKYIASVHIPNETYNLSDKDFKNKKEQLIEYMQKNNSNTENIVLPSISEHYDPNHMDDKKPWNTHYNGEDSFSGVYFSKMPSLNDAKQYFIIASSDAGPKIASELQSIIHHEKPTAAEFANDPRVQWAKSVGRRNTLRLAAEIANVIGVKVKTILDERSKTPKHHKMSQLAEPDTLISMNTVAARDFGKGVGEKVAFYNGAADGAEGISDTLILGSPFHDIHKYQGKKTSIDNKPIYNRHFNALPVYTSKLPVDKESDIESLPEGVQEKLKKKIYTAYPIDANLLMKKTHSTREKHSAKSFNKIAGAYGLSTLDFKTKVFKPVLYCLNLDPKDEDLDVEQIDSKYKYSIASDPAFM